MKFTTSREEIWGSFPTEDVLANYFINNFELSSLVDVETILLSLTWYNSPSDP